MTILSLCKLPILFSTVKLKLGYILSQFIHRFKIWINVGLELCILPSFSLFIKVVNWDFWKAKAALPNFSQFSKMFENWDFWSLLAFIFLLNGEDSLSAQHVAQERRSKFTIKLLAFNQRCLYYNVGNNFISVKSWKYCFQTQMRV